jgi:saccharopine dehydrogenase-like NADP-dependent oxidoreductase
VFYLKQSMQTILLFGAGKSSSYLVQYLLNQAESNQYKLLVVDQDLKAIEKLTNKHNYSEAIVLDIFQEVEKRKTLIQSAKLVISMIPAHLHIDIAKDCIAYKKSMITASYISPEMKSLDEEAKANGVLLLNEMGLDPGLDHMITMKVINDLKEKGGKMLLYESFCGGLVAPESDNNLWQYKFTWNPRNVVLAGQGGVSKFIQENKFKYIPYHKLFRRTEFMNIPGYGMFEGYANRDSLKYIKIYGLDDVKTMYRGTLRRVGFCKAWDILVQLGMTDDTYTIDGSESMTYRQFTNSFLSYHPTDSVELKLRHYLKLDHDDPLWFKLQEIDLFNADKKVGLKQATPAQILEKILKDNWTLQEEDKDMIVMYNKFGYEMNGELKQIDATLVCEGVNQTYTAMAKTVGMPVAISALMVFKNELNLTGVHLPILKEIYEPILEKLKDFDVEFKLFDTKYMGYI